MSSFDFIHRAMKINFCCFHNIICQLLDMVWIGCLLVTHNHKHLSVVTYLYTPQTTTATIHLNLLFVILSSVVFARQQLVMKQRFVVPDHVLPLPASNSQPDWLKSKSILQPTVIWPVSLGVRQPLMKDHYTIFR